MAARHNRRAPRWHHHSRLARATLVVVCALTSATDAGASIRSQWSLDFLKADKTWTITRGSGIRIAVVDTGVQPNADLSEHLLPGADFSGHEGVSTGEGHIDTDAFGHGTGEVSLIVGSDSDGRGTEGLAPEASILPIRASDGSSSGFTFGLAPSVEYAVSHGAGVINMALTDSFNDQEIHKAVQDALDHDVVVVAAVGNDGTSQQYYPAAWPGVVGVGAIDSSGAVWSQSNSGADVALVAPGVHILRDDNQGRVGYSDGTSEATAYVSAAAALVRSAHPRWSAVQVVAALESTADKPAAMRGAARDDRYGAGILDVLAAVRLAEPPVVGGPAAAAARGAGGG
ncbi:S8 family serine peptidase, partial [Catenulispora rubra]|uniref:S8 family serine peptidase n=1 Tax=Catenulispora rubra TaxID=280293 RepID=UPI00189246BC